MAGKRDDLRIPGNGLAERARKKLKERKDKQKSRLDEIMGSARTSLGIKQKKGSKSK